MPKYIVTVELFIQAATSGEAEAKAGDILVLGCHQCPWAVCQAELDTGADDNADDDPEDNQN